MSENAYRTQPKPNTSFPEVTGQTAADLLGCSAPWIRKLEVQGSVERKENGLFDPFQVALGYIKFLKDAERRSSKTEVGKLKEAEQLRKLQIENAKAIGQLVDVETVELAFAEMFMLCRNAISGVPAGVIRDLKVRAEIEKLQDAAFE